MGMVHYPSFSKIPFLAFLRMNSKFFIKRSLHKRTEILVSKFLVLGLEHPTLDSGIDIERGKFGNKNKRKALNKHRASKI